MVTSTRTLFRLFSLVTVAICLLLVAMIARADRIKDIASVAGVRTNQLVGYGLVVVALGDGRFAPRQVTLGAESDNLVEIAAGLADGERIATSAQFLIDSESNLQASFRRMGE